MSKQKYIELIDKYLVKQSTDTEYNPPSYEWVDNIGEIIRCKDCKHSEEFIYPEGLEIMVCWEGNADREVNRNGFCEKGERKDG